MERVFTAKLPTWGEGDYIRVVCNPSAVSQADIPHIEEVKAYQFQYVEQFLPDKIKNGYYEIPEKIINTPKAEYFPQPLLLTY